MDVEVPYVVVVFASAARVARPVSEVVVASGLTGDRIYPAIPSLPRGNFASPRREMGTPLTVYLARIICEFGGRIHQGYQCVLRAEVFPYFAALAQ